MILVTRNLPHANLPMGQYKKVFSLNMCVDSCAGINLGGYNFHMALSKLYPEVVSQIIDLTAIGQDIHIGGINAHGNGIKVTHVISYWMPNYQDGAQARVAFGFSKKVAATTLVGIGFLRATNAICHFTGNEPDLHLQAIGLLLDVTYKPATVCPPPIHQDSTTVYTAGVYGPTDSKDRVENKMNEE